MAEQSSQSGDWRNQLSQGYAVRRSIMLAAQERKR